MTKALSFRFSLYLFLVVDISFFCDFSQFLREGQYEEKVKEQGFNLISKSFPEEYRNDSIKVSGCQAQVWLVPKLNENKLSFYYYSDAFI